MSRSSPGEPDFRLGDLPTSRTASSKAEPGGHEQEIDARGVSPPLPLLRAHRALRKLQPGQPLKVITSYPESMAEFQAMVKYIAGYDLLEQEQLGEDFIHVLVRRH